MAYTLQYDAGVLKSMLRFPRADQARIVAHIAALGENPRPQGCVKLAGKDQFRIRIGNYRVIYSIYDKKLIVLVIDVGDRKDVYRRK